MARKRRKPEYNAEAFWTEVARKHYEAGVAMGRVDKMLERYDREDVELGLTVKRYYADDVEEGIECPF